VDTEPETGGEIDALLTPGIARVAGGAGLLSAAAAVLSSAQTLAVIYIDGPAAAAPYLILALGVATAVAGFKLLGGHGWAAIASTALNGVLFLFGLLWVLYSMANAYFSAPALMNPLLAAIAGVLSLLAIKPCLRVSDARRPRGAPDLFKNV
jgi:hypothetical protein